MQRDGIMPELPEVECIRLNLLSGLPGKSIKQVAVYNQRTVKHPSVAGFCSGLQNKTFSEINRHGKYLIFLLQPQAYLLIHLGMTGKLLMQDSQEMKPVHLRVLFELKDSPWDLHFVDIRKFGRVALFNDQQSLKEYINLGPDALEELTLTEFKQICRGNGSIKSILLDQKKVGGIGNIYADEALFAAGIHPQTKVCDIDPQGLHSLYEAIKEVLIKGIYYGGTSFRDYVHADGTQGENQDHLKVYGRKGKECYVCKTALSTRKIAGRTTTYCPNCQRCENG
jgi:formamidopyrimidine-DNA glycosylase